MPIQLNPPDQYGVVDCGILSRGEVYFMGANDNQYVTLDEFVAPWLGDILGQAIGCLVVQNVPDGAAAAAVTHIGRGGSMRLYIKQ